MRRPAPVSHFEGWALGLLGLVGAVLFSPVDVPFSCLVFFFFSFWLVQCVAVPVQMCFVFFSLHKRPGGLSTLSLARYLTGTKRCLPWCCAPLPPPPPRS